MKAILNDVLLAHSNNTQQVEGNHYFPRDSVNWERLKQNDAQYHCPWKGDCTFYDVTLGGAVFSSAAWSYENPKPAADNIKGYVAFDRPIEVQQSEIG